MSTPYDYETFDTEFVAAGVLHVMMNRPRKLNAMSMTMFMECKRLFEQADRDGDVRCIVLSGNGRIFTAGLDLKDAGANLMDPGDGKGGTVKSDIGRKAMKLMSTGIRIPQDGLTAIEDCRVPVICVLHSAVVGGGVDMACACDIRLCTDDAYFCIKEVDVGLAADIGTLQRMPKLGVSDSLVRELCYTARKMHAPEAKTAGFVSDSFPDKAACVAAAVKMASTIASKSPIAVVATKKNLVFSRDHSVADGLEHVRVFNSAMLQSTDLVEAMMSSMAKKPATFAKL